MREAAARDDHWAQVSADDAFHHTIINAAGNRMLEHVWQTMRLSVTTCVTHSLTHRSLHEITERHVPVLEALRTRDPVMAEAAIRRHIEEPGEWIRASGAAEIDRQPADRRRAGRVAGEPKFVPAKVRSTPAPVRASRVTRYAGGTGRHCQPLRPHT